MNEYDRTAPQILSFSDEPNRCRCHAIISDAATRCDECRAEDAHEQSVEDFYGGSSPQTVDEHLAAMREGR
jgi:hypothetical protein